MTAGESKMEENLFINFPLQRKKKKYFLVVVKLPCVDSWLQSENKLTMQFNVGISIPRNKVDSQVGHSPNAFIGSINSSLNI